MKRIISLGIIAINLLILCSLAGCTKRNEFLGTWSSNVPTSLSTELPQNATATSMVSIKFTEYHKHDFGNFTLSTLININQYIENDTITIEPYEVDLVATASVNGKWAWMGKNDNEDLVLTFDMNSLQVEINSDSVMFSKNLLRAVQEDELNALSSVLASKWQKTITRALLNKISNYGVLEDVEVQNDILTFELNGDKDNEYKMSFNRVKPQ